MMLSHYFKHQGLLLPEFNPFCTKNKAQSTTYRIMYVCTILTIHTTLSHLHPQQLCKSKQQNHHLQTKLLIKSIRYLSTFTPNSKRNIITALGTTHRPFHATNERSMIQEDGQFSFSIKYGARVQHLSLSCRHSDCPVGSSWYRGCDGSWQGPSCFEQPAEGHLLWEQLDPPSRADQDSIASCFLSSHQKVPSIFWAERSHEWFWTHDG